MSHTTGRVDAPLYLCPSDRAARAWRRLLKPSGSGAVPACRAVESWMVDLWQQAMLFGWLPDSPQLLPATALRGLWLPLVEANSSMLAAEREVAAAQAADTWQLAIRHGYPFPRVSSAAARNDNVSWFTDLAQSARAWLHARQLATCAELPRLLASHASRVLPLVPTTIRLTPTFAADPALEALWQALRAYGVDIAGVAGPDWKPLDDTCTSIRVERSMNEEHEVARALNWIEQRLADPMIAGEGAVTLIVPNLAQCRERWQRSLRMRFNPAWWQDPTTDRDHFDLSLGRSLADHTSVRALITLLQATAQPIDVELVAQALTHPRWAWTSIEVGRVHAHLRELMDRGIASTLLAVWPLPPLAQAIVQRIAENGRRRSPRTAHVTTVEEFIAAFTQRALIGRSELFQLEEAWRTLLREWSGHDEWFAPLGWPAAVSELARLARDTVFQPESGVGRIHVIGLLESAGVPLSCARLVGMTDQVLPERVAPNPLLPRPWQAQARVGLGSRTEVAARAARLVGNWRALIPDLTVSYAAESADGPTSLSPLFATWPVVDAPLPAALPAATSAQRPSMIESIRDESLPVSASEIAVKDSTTNAAQAPLSPSRLREQAQCPRRAAAQRLGLEHWPTLSPGITPLVRGNLVHGMLAAYGAARRAAAAQDEPPDATALTHAGLNALDELIELERIARPSIAAVIWQAERARIAGLLEQVLAIDAARSDMAVVAVEAETRATVAGQGFRGKVDRVDAGGGVRIILDYKTGSVSRGDWIPDKNDGRLADPQLPLYALMDHATTSDATEGANRDPVRGVAWFVVSDDRVECIGVGDDDRVVGGRQAPELQTWDSAVMLWQPAIAALVAEWQAGVADVAPLKGRATCQHCEYGAFCRERWSLAGAEEGADGADSGSVDGPNDPQVTRND